MDSEITPEGIIIELGQEFWSVSVSEFQLINRLANAEGLMAKVTFIEDGGSPEDRTLDFHLVRMP